MSNSEFDAEGFYSALDSERLARKKTWKQVATDSHVSASTLTRMGQGKRPDVDSLAALVNWSGIKVEQYLVGSVTRSRNPETLTQMSSLLRADKNLTKEGAETIEAIVKSAYEKLRKHRSET